MTQRLLTGDTPTGQLHLGHYVGSVENRLALQDEYECYFLLANTHAFSTRAEQPHQVRQSVLDIALDYLSCGIDPARSVILPQNESLGGSPELASREPALRHEAVAPEK